MEQMDCLRSLSSSSTDFSELDAIFGPDARIAIINGEGICLAANQRALISFDLEPKEAIGKHVDELIEGYCFERMARQTFDKVLCTGIPIMVADRVHPHRQLFFARIRTLMLRIPWGPEFAVLNVSHEVPDFLVEALRNYNPKTKTIPGTVSGIPMRWVDIETFYLILRCSSIKEIATLLRRSDDAVRLRLQALADYLEKTFSAMGHSVLVPPTLKDMQPLLRNWPLNDVVLAGCINRLNVRYGKNTVSIAGFDAERKVEDALREDNLRGVSAAQLLQILLKEANKLSRQ